MNKTQERVVFDITGEIDEQGADKLKSAFQDLDISSVTEVVLNFSKVTHIGSAGIGKLLMLYKDVGVRGGIFQVSNVSAAIYTLLLSLKLDTVFTIQKQTITEKR